MGNNQSSSSRDSSKPTNPVAAIRSRTNTLDKDAKVTVEGGFLEPQTLLYNHIEYHRPTVHKLIVDRKLSPFYLGLLDFEDDWDLDQIVAALGEAEQQATQNLKDALNAATESANDADAQQLNCPPGTRKHKEAVQAYNAAVLHRERLAEVLKVRERRGGGGLQWSSKPEQAKLYKGCALECPICFLYYPPNMVHTRCCDQPLCTECFVQIKRADPTPTHLESEPACCPFCMEPNFGCVYAKPAPQRPSAQTVLSGGSGSSTATSDAAASTSTAPKPRRKSFAHTEKEVVTTDMVHPDWETKLEAMKATVARRANRRIVFRQVGDRLIPVGITSSRGTDGSAPTMATTSLPPNFLSQIAAALDSSNEGGSGRRRGSRSSRRRGSSAGNDELAALLESLGLGGAPDIEEMMLQEAMRLSQLEEEERQKKSREEEEAKAKAAAAASPSAAPASDVAAPLEVPRTPRTTERLLSEAMAEESALSTSPSPPPPPAPLSASVAAPPPADSPSSPAPPSASTSTGPAPLLNLDIPSTPLEAPSLDTPIATRTNTDTIPEPVPSTSTSAPLADLATLEASTLSAVPTATSTVPSSGASTSDAASLLSVPSASAGYEPLGDESDAASLVSRKHAAAPGEHLENGRVDA
ncbi:hypothetical protein JCM10207_004079 [Rhodosporidiobolus poonsookiae]